MRKNTYNPDYYTEEARIARFHRLIPDRVTNILQALSFLGNCANKSIYKYNQQEIEKIFKAIELKVWEIKGKFTNNKHREFHF